MNLGLFIIPIRFKNHNLYPFDYLDLCVEAEKAGYSEIYIGEHLTDFREDIRSSMIFAASLASRTKKIKICLSVLPLPHYNVQMLWAQLKDLFLLSEGRLKIGIGPGALDSDLNYLNIDLKSRYSLYQDNLKKLLEEIEKEDSKYFTLRENLFSTVLSPFPINSEKLYKLNIKILSSNFSNRNNLNSHINCYTSNNVSSVGLKNWSIAHNFFGKNINQKSKETILASFQYIHKKLGDKAPSIMGIDQNIEFQRSTLFDYKNLLPDENTVNFGDYIKNTLVIKDCNNHILNVFDCLDDDNYVDSLLQLGKIKNLR